MVEEPQGELPIEPGERGETVAEKDTEVRLPAHTEAGRQESIVEDLQPSDNDPPSEVQPLEAANKGLNTPQDQEIVRKKQTPKDKQRVVDYQRGV
jgi:hypothetical protein